MEAREGERLETFSHTFTHFKLRITPLRVELACRPLRVEQAGRVWLPVGEALGAAIPTPVRSVLQALIRRMG
jgi:A/G-specific adenine glycosylase